MNWNGEEYSRRLETYSDDTMLLISQCNTKAKFMKAAEIVMTTDTEEEVVKKLRKLKEQTQ